MMRNDYRRSLILLRNNLSGYSGHARLERRTLTGSMSIVAQTPPDAGRLEAALVGSGRCGTYACPMGRLRRDGRGQAVLNWTFDPRDICARTLEDYALIVISEVTDSACGVVLFGNVDGHAELDWHEARDVLCRLYGASGLEQPSPRRMDSPPTPAAPSARSAEPEAMYAEPTPEAPSAQSVEPEAMYAEPTAEAEIEEALPEAEQPVILSEALPTEEMPVEAESALPEEGLMEAPAPIAEEAPPIEARQTAMEALGLDPAQPWQEAVEPLRQAFLEQSPVQDAPDERYVYVSLPMPAEAGASEMLAGIRAEDGVPAAASYAIPAPWSAEPPAGLEDYAWSGDQNGGWWVAEMDVRTGTRL